MDQTAQARKDTASENVGVVQSLYDAFGRGDVEAVFGLTHPECEIYQSSRMPWGGSYKGHEGLGEFLAKLTGAIESRVETERYIDDEEDHVVAIGRTRGTVLANGNRFDVPETHLWTLREGKVVRLESYIDTKTMREALEL